MVQFTCAEKSKRDSRHPTTLDGLILDDVPRERSVRRTDPHMMYRVSGQISGQIPEIFTKFRSLKSYRNSVCGFHRHKSVRANALVRAPTTAADHSSSDHRACVQRHVRSHFPSSAVTGEGTRAARTESAGTRKTVRPLVVGRIQPSLHISVSRERAGICTSLHSSVSRERAVTPSN